MKALHEWRAAGARIIDVRDPDEFNDTWGHIPGAQLVPLGMLPYVAQDWHPDEPLVMVCRSGRRSARATDLLRERGFRRVFDLEGGMQAYVESGLPVERTG